MASDVKLLRGDCLDLMKTLDAGSVDLVLTDPPYGTTECEWDNGLDWSLVWRVLYEKKSNKNTPMLLFSQMPFTVDLTLSNRKDFRYEWIWVKPQGTGFLNSHKMPLKSHENILVFYENLPLYKPQKNISNKKKRGMMNKGTHVSTVYNNKHHEIYIDDGFRFPTDVIKTKIEKDRCDSSKNRQERHPTQKPVALLEYLIKTYTNAGDTVLDFTMGSGSTGVACVNTDRNFIGIEKDEHYFEIAERRIKAAQAQPRLFLEDELTQTPPSACVQADIFAENA